MGEYLQLYIEEAKEHLESMSKNLLILEKDYGNQEAVKTLFRSAHTLKSSSAMMGFQDLSDLAHAMEDLFDQIRKGKKLSTNIMNVILEGVDAFATNLRMIKEESGEKIELSGLTKRVHEINDGLSRQIEATSVTPEIKTQSEKDAEAKTQPEKDHEGDLAASLVTSQSIRVHADRLDEMLNLVGELVINKIALLQAAGRLKDDSLANTAKSIDRLTDDLQYIVMGIRMVPVKQIFDRFPRVVRDLALKKGKEAELEVEGGDIEVDRTVLDEIGQPLLHLIRNSIDHGIESPEERAKAGKSKIGRIKLTAQRKLDHVYIVVEDDGGGIDPVKIRDKAIEKGFITKAEADVLTREECIDLIFLPGLSTAKEITDTSGRGVGMDVVKTNIMALGGTVRIDTTEGVGTRTTMSLPLTVAISNALLVKSSDHTFAIPINKVQEVINVRGDEIQSTGKSEAIMLRGDAIPIRHLRTILGEPQPVESEKSYEVLILNRGVKTAKLGVTVDRVVGLQEILLKPLDDSVEKEGGFSGVTILGDGGVILVLDLDGIS
jgi:two-component system chemotaxis sensor kinase CheA